MSYTPQSLASGIFENEFDNDETITSESKIKFWLEANVGALNSLIYTSFDDDFTCPDNIEDCNFGHEEANIYSLLYMKHFYGKASRSTLLGKDLTSTQSKTASGMSDWTRIQEGDTVIERQPLYSTTSTSKVSENYADLLASTDSDLRDLVARYNLYGASPSQVHGKDGV